MNKVSRVGRSYPKTGQDSQTRADESPFWGRRCRHGVWVPRTIRDGAFSATEVAVYAVLLAWSPRGGGSFLVGQERLMRALGRSGHSADAVRRATKSLVKAGVLTAARRHGRALLRYEALVRPEPGQGWDVVPRELLAALEAGHASVVDVRAWLHLDQALGARGFTTDTLEDLAARAGGSVVTWRRRLATFLRLGLITSTPTRDGRMLGLTRAAQPLENAPNGSQDAAPQMPVPAITNAAPAITNAGSISNPTPEYPTPDPAPSELRSDRPVSDARTPATSGLRPKKKFSRPTGGVHATPGVSEVLDKLGPDWTTGPARRWANGIAAAIASQLAAGMTPGAAAGALIDLGDGFLEDCGGRHVVAARQALRTRAAEIRWGLACTDCGRHEDHHDGIHLEHGMCGACRDEAGITDEIPAEVLDAVYAHFGLASAAA
jgi:hypothetical protein